MHQTTLLFWFFYAIGSLRDALIGRAHFSVLEWLRRPEVVLHAYPLVFLLSTEQKHSELAHLRLEKQFGVKIVLLTADPGTLKYYNIHIPI